MMRAAQFPLAGITDAHLVRRTRLLMHDALASAAMRTCLKSAYPLGVPIPKCDNLRPHRQ